MEETLKQLSDLQIKALRKGISFDIDLYVNEKQIPTTTVKMMYTVTGGISKGYTYNTTFNNTLDRNKQDKRLADINYFISTVTGPTEQ